MKFDYTNGICKSDKVAAMKEKKFLKVKDSSLESFTFKRFETGLIEDE